MTTTVVDIALADIVPSPFNHRRAFRDMEQLADSIKARGVLQPVTVRKIGKGHELVFGERRWRASKLAGVESIPAIVRTMSDVEVLEAQLIENVQRADVHALEEADGYKELLDKHKYDVETIAAKTGKSKAYVYARLKLCALAPVPRNAFLEDKLNPSVALLIARIPDVKLQTQALEDVLEPSNWKHELDYEEDGKRQREVVPLSIRQAQVHIQSKYMLRLDQAPFDIADATLFAKAGACTACPHRTGNQRELFADVKSGDVCANPPCFESKKSADFDRKAAEATRAGVRVLNKKETENVFTDYAKTGVGHNSAYVDPNDQVPYELNPGRPKTWKQLLGKEQPAKVLARDGAGNARVLFDRKSALAKLEKSGKLKELKREAKSARSSSTHDQDRLKRERAQKQRHRIARQAFGRLGELARPRVVKNVDDLKFWRWLAHAVLRMLDSEDCRNLCKRREIDAKLGNGQAEKELAKIIDEQTSAAYTIALVVEFASAFRAVGGMWAGQNYGQNFTTACEVLGLDLKKLGAELAAVEKARAKKPAPASAKKSKGSAP
jgi:ParB/RepB/Spo0J family partition protein